MWLWRNKWTNCRSVKFHYLQDARLEVKNLILKEISQNHKSSEWNILCFKSLENIIICFLFNSLIILLQMLIWWILREKMLFTACPLEDGLVKSLCRIFKVFPRKETLLHVTHFWMCADIISCTSHREATLLLVPLKNWRGFGTHCDGLEGL